MMTDRADFIIPECYVDTNLIETLVCHGGCNHQKGCNQVAKVMQEKFADRFAVGIIDADKRRPGYLSEFYEVSASEHIQLLRHPVRDHFMILIRPAVDGFIIFCAEDAGIDMSYFGFSTVMKEFTAQTKKVLSNKDPRFKSLFKAMKSVGEMALLESVVTYFVNHKYRSTDDRLRSMFAGHQNL